MTVHYDPDNLPSFKNAVLTIGSFDGVHAGHRKIIERVKNLAEEYDGESVLLTFHPHPRLVLQPKNNQLQLLNTIQEKADSLAAIGVDHLVIIPFTKAFAQQSPEEYIEQFLIKKFHPRCVVIGYDHKFGNSRKGNINFLKKYTEKHNFIVEEIPAQHISDMAVSSTKIRKALQQGDVKKAGEYLGRPFALTGKVVEGQRIGRKIGYPTANITVFEKEKLIPSVGIYAVKVKIETKEYDGMLYIGNRPTLPKYNNQMIEVNIFDFNQDIYNKIIKIKFIDYIRGDKQFKNLEELSAQLKQDKIDTIKILR